MSPSSGLKEDLFPESAAAPGTPSVRPPRGRGTGLFIASGSVGGLALLVRLGVSVNVLRDRSRDPYGAGILYNPMFGASLGMLGGGRAKQARRQVWELQYGTPELVKKVEYDRRKRELLGWSFFGVGAGVWLLSRFALVMAPEPTDGDPDLKLSELGYLLSLPFSYAGMAIGPYETAFRRELAKAKAKAKVAPVATARFELLPQVGPGYQGLSFAGSF